MGVWVTKRTIGLSYYIINAKICEDVWMLVFFQRKKYCTDLDETLYYLCYKCDSNSVCLSCFYTQTAEPTSIKLLFVAIADKHAGGAARKS